MQQASVDGAARPDAAKVLVEARNGAAHGEQP
jgi:hypothetical protein